MGLMSTPLAFLLGLGLLIGVHEYGHFRVALWCGVRVLRFSIGMGPVVWRWQSAKTGIEYALSAIPLGGYVRMLDSREAPVLEQDRARAFDAQPVSKRALIVLAGPLANFVLALSLYTGLYWWGVPQVAPVLASPVEQSVLEKGGLESGDRVLYIRSGEQTDAIQSLEDFTWHLTQLAAVSGEHLVQLGVRRGSKELELPIALQSDASAPANDAIRAWGFAGPWSEAVIAGVSPDGAAQAAGLQANDQVLSVDGRSVSDSQQLRRWIAGSAKAGPPEVQLWEVRRHDTVLTLEVRPRLEGTPDQPVGRVGAYIGKQPEPIVPELSFGAALGTATQKVWDVSALSLSLLGKMVTGDASLSNLSGPLTIADYAGRSAHAGWMPYALFLGLISVSLGVLNLLPLPMLDGGHLMVYIYEGLMGRPLADRWQELLQRIGMVVLAAGMSIALYNDLARLLG